MLEKSYFLIFEAHKASLIVLLQQVYPVYTFTIIWLINLNILHLAMLLTYILY
jgi:hypothetical protein